MKPSIGSTLPDVTVPESLLQPCPELQRLPEGATTTMGDLYEFVVTQVYPQAVECAASKDDLIKATRALQDRLNQR